MPPDGTPPDDWSRIDAAFDRALDLDGPERDAFLDGLDADTRAALVPLLRDAFDDDPVLDHPRSTLATLVALPDAPAGMRQGVRVGPYELGEMVGEGGMGRVYRAHRADGAYQQTVAVKVVRRALTLAGLDVSARLRHERSLLAALDHPGIARLVDGGETEDGVPYLVTEFVDGTPITDYAAGLDLRARVALVVQVARAVEHAHRRFVVHRDLKPSNVLVTERDGEPRPVVLDFGIAKLLDEADEQNAPVTRTGARLLTPAYAAPELYDASGTVTTAADVYGLGALLYEVITGRRPAGGETLAPATVRPSRAVAQSGREGARLARALEGDLDVICLRALARDPARRYGSAEALADDLERYLDGRPVDAQPDRLAYTLSRIVRRNPVATAAAGVALAALVVGFAVALFALSAERRARAAGETQAQRATEAAELLAGILHTSNPDYAPGRQVTVVEAIADGVERVRAVESDSLRAYLLRVFGEVYIDQGEPALADPLLREAVAIHGAAGGPEASLARQRLILTRDALSDPDGVIALARRLVRDRPDDADVALRALWAESRAFADLGRHDESVASARRAVAFAEGQGAVARARAAVRLGDALTGAGRTDAAVAQLRRGVQLTEAEYGRSHTATASARATLGYALGLSGAIDEAETILGEVLAFHAQQYGTGRIGYPLAMLGEANLNAGRLGRAALLLDSAATMVARIVEPDHLDAGLWRLLEAEARVRLGEPGAAEAAARGALAAARVDRPATPQWMTSRAQGWLGLALQGQGRTETAAPLLRDANAALAARRDEWTPRDAALHRALDAAGTPPRSAP